MNSGGGRAARTAWVTQLRRTRKMSLVPARFAAMRALIRTGPVINSPMSSGFACWARTAFRPTPMATNVGGLITPVPMVLHSGNLGRAVRFGDSGLIRVDLRCSESFGVVNRGGWQGFFSEGVL